MERVVHYYLCSIDSALVAAKQQFQEEAGARAKVSGYWAVLNFFFSNIYIFFSFYSYNFFFIWPLSLNARSALVSLLCCNASLLVRLV